MSAQVPPMTSAAVNVVQALVLVLLAPLVIVAVGAPVVLLVRLIIEMLT